MKLENSTQAWIMNLDYFANYTLREKSLKNVIFKMIYLSCLKIKEYRKTENAFKFGLRSGIVN